MATTVRKLAADIRKFDRGYRRFSKGVLEEEGEKLIRFIKRTKFRSAGNPGPKSIVSRTGRLEGSLRAITKFAGKGLTLEIEMSGVQARILEEGGTTRPHIIRARRAAALAFFWAKAGNFVFFKRVHHPGSRFKPRRILSRSFEQRSTQLVRNIERELLKEWERRIG